MTASMKSVDLAFFANRVDGTIVGTSRTRRTVSTVIEVIHLRCSQQHHNGGDTFASRRDEEIVWMCLWRSILLAASLFLFDSCHPRTRLSFTSTCRPCSKHVGLTPTYIILLYFDPRSPHLKLSLRCELSCHRRDRRHLQKTPSPRFSSMQSSVATVLTDEAGSSRYSSMKNAPGMDTGWIAPGWLEFPVCV